jgi:hypothetical protein
MQFTPCESLLLEAGSWGTGIVRELRLRGTTTVESRYQETIGEDTADWEDILRVVMNCKVYELVIEL